VRALVVSHTARVDNPDQFIFGLLRYRPAEVRPVCVFLEDGPDVQAMLRLGVEATALRAGRTRDVRRMAGVIRTLGGRIRRLGADVVVAQTSKAQVYAGAAAALRRVPAVWFQSELPGSARGMPGQGQWLQQVAARVPSRAVVCTSDFVAREHRTRWPGSPVHRIYPGVRTEGIAAHRHQPGGEVRVAVVGRLQRWRRVELALDALALALRDEPRLRLVIVGAARPDFDADYPDQLRAQAASLGIEHAVEFLGAVPDPSDRIGEVDVLLHVADREPFGQPVVEALLRGVPAVVPPDGGPAEVVRDGVDGIVVDPTDAPALAAALVQLARDPARRAAMGAAGRDRAQERFDARLTAAETWRLLEEVVSGPPAAQRGAVAR
jgi:glycosyltransferase involved in cell wall biosynthesis